MSAAERFPGAAGDWARFDGPAGTQMIDVAIEATRAWSASGDNANSGGEFAAARATDELLDSTRATVAALLGAGADGVWFGPNMTTMTLAFTRALSRTWQPGDRIVVTTLDHDADVTPWRLAAEDRGAEVVAAPFDVDTGRLVTTAVTALVDDRTRWVAVTGASNLLGTMPDVAAITRAAHAAGARVFVDAVHLVPHRRVDVAALGCDALVTSAYKWYGPHAAAMWVEPELLESLRPYKVRPAPDHGPARFETGTPSFEALAGVRAAAQSLLDDDIDTIGAAEGAVFGPLLDGLLDLDGVHVVGPHDLGDRTPTVSFTVAGHHPDEVARELAADRVAVWSGHSYAVEAATRLGVADTGGVVRAGVVRYVTADDVRRLLDAVARIAKS
jgi:cysteine desulfurase family protein (TIGR01976 family)